MLTIEANPVTSDMVSRETPSDVPPPTPCIRTVAPVTGMSLYVEEVRLTNKDEPFRGRLKFSSLALPPDNSTATSDDSYPVATASTL